MSTYIQLGEIAVDVVKKDIRNVHLSVHPPTGRVRISAPLRMDLNTIRTFAISKIGWIRKQQIKHRQQERETPREYIDRESHFVWGKRYLLKVIENHGVAGVELTYRQILLKVPLRADAAKKQATLDEWYRELIKQTVAPLLAKWEQPIGVKVNKVFVQRMKTKWGGCNPLSSSIRLNTHLAKKPKECLEYVLVHEMVHLLERHHNDRFAAYMDSFMPNWQHHRDELNSFPLCYETWSY